MEFPILYLKGKRILMFQLSGFYHIPVKSKNPDLSKSLN